MKINKDFIPTIVWFLILILLLMTIIGVRENWHKPRIKVGQQWVVPFGSNPNNPFKETIWDTTTVLEIRGNYVLYRSSHLNNTTHSSSKYWFKVSAKLIKD